MTFHGCNLFRMVIGTSPKNLATVQLIVKIAFQDNPDLPMPLLWSEVNGSFHVHAKIKKKYEMDAGTEHFERNNFSASTVQRLILGITFYEGNCRNQLVISKPNKKIRCLFNERNVG